MNCNLGTLRFWTTFLRLEYLHKQQNNIALPLGLNFEFPMGIAGGKLNWLHPTLHFSNSNPVQLNTKIKTETKFATLLLKERKNWTLSVLEIELHYKWIYKFSFESPTGGNPTPVLPTLSIQNVPKKGFKILQKCNFYFKMLLKCFEIDSKCNSILKMLPKCSKNAALSPICFK